MKEKIFDYDYTLKSEGIHTCLNFDVDKLGETIMSILKNF